MRKWVKMFLLSTVTLNEGQGHSNWHLNVEYCDLCDRTKFERGQLVNLSVQANIKGFSFEPHQTKKSQQQSKFRPNLLRTLWDNLHWSVCFLACIWPSVKFNPYYPDVAHHIINKLSKLLLRTHSALECEANESVHWRTFWPISPYTQQIYIQSL